MAVRPDIVKFKSKPEHPADRKGTLLVVGSAPNLYEDMIRAINMRGRVDVMALNEAGGAIPDIDYLFAGHHVKTSQFIKYREKKQPNGNTNYEVHACWIPGRTLVMGVDYWWEYAVTGGTAAFTGAGVGLNMGYDEIILCGCPLDGSGYFNNEETHKHTRLDPRVGTDKATMEVYQERFATMAFHRGDGIYSMSGFTKEVLGEPRSAA